MPKERHIDCKEAPKTGRCIRARLVRADYDVRPKVTAVEGFLFEVWQKDTRSECHTFQKTNEIVLKSELAKEAYVNVFCKEEKGPSYRSYAYDATGQRKGRYYTQQDAGARGMVFRFDRALHGYGPAP